MSTTKWFLLRLSIALVIFLTLLTFFFVKMNEIHERSRAEYWKGAYYELWEFAEAIGVPIRNVSELKRW